ncbi:MAG: geranylgeranylglyceryl/heptaprenylglyceryl phosphate synthase [Bacteroidota bacterium]
MNTLYQKLVDYRAQGRKAFAMLIDPDKVGAPAMLAKHVRMAVEHKVDLFLVGGSLITDGDIGKAIEVIKSQSEVPVVLFPGSNMHIDISADAILFLSLISGRNPELLIGQHVVAAPVLKRSRLEVISTGYILVESGNRTTVAYMSNTQPIPAEKHSVAASTAVAGEMLGMKMIYLDGGSGAKNPVPYKMINLVRKSVDVPLIVGGGIDSREKAHRAMEAGADLLIIGNGIEKNPNLLVEISEKVSEFNQALAPIK